MQAGPGVWVSRTQAIIILLLFATIVIGVGLMAGLIRAPCSSNAGSDTSTTVVMTTGGSTPPMTTTPPEEDGPWQHPFLPDTIVPVHYDMWFYPDFYYSGGTFTGKSDIEINVTSSTSHLIVHYKMMNITMTTVQRKADNASLDISRTFAYDRNQYWVTELKSELVAGDVVILHLEFAGSLLNGIVGYYKSTYVNSLTGKESWMATTKFQPTDARKAFPNFDEPKYKATFTITLKHWNNFTALSNMPEERTISYDFWNETTFERSVPMSSYLVCFIVTDFKYKSNYLRSGVLQRVWARPDSIDQVDYGLEVAKKVMDFFEVEFGQDFHLPKLDHVAVPDYPSGATEHWGLITYRQARLLYDPAQVTALDKQSVANIVAHEVAHNYFGNLVTCFWWDELWLNEGFATFYENKGTEAAEPSWQTYFGNLVTCYWWDELWLNEGFARFYQNKGVEVAEPTWAMEDGFVVSTQQSIMRSDATATSRPVVLPVTVPDEINQAFDGVVYNKGASVLRMMEDFFGNNTFRNSIRRFLRDNKFGTAITPDLWAAFQEEVGSSMNVTEVMNPWVYQMGLPVIDITVEPSNGGSITATPKRLLTNPEDPIDKPDSPYGYKWYLSLSYQTPTTEGRQWLNKTELTISDPRSDPATQWIKFNRKQSGFYRVNYPEDLWSRLSTQLQTDHSMFEPIDRSHLLDDVLNLAAATQVSYQTALDMSRYLAKEMHYFPWRTVSSSLLYINSILYGNQYYSLYRSYTRDLTSAAMEKLQVADGGEHLDILLRSYIINLACLQDHPGCVSNITALFKGWIEDPVANPVPANLRPFVYRFGMMKSGTETDWEVMWGRYENATSGQDSLYILRGYLEYCLDESKVRSQDFFTAVNYAAENPTATGYVWSWARANYDDLLKRFGTQDRYFGRMIPNIVTGFKSKFHLEEVQSFYAKYPDAGSGATPRVQSLNSIRNNIEWREKNEDKVISWLRANVQS